MFVGTDNFKASIKKVNKLNSLPIIVTFSPAGKFVMRCHTYGAPSASDGVYITLDEDGTSKCVAHASHSNKFAIRVREVVSREGRWCHVILPLQFTS